MSASIDSLSGRADLLPVIDREVSVWAGRMSSRHTRVRWPHAQQHHAKWLAFRAVVAEMVAFQEKAAPLARAIVGARTEADEADACKALAKLYNDDLDTALASAGGDQC